MLTILFDESLRVRWNLADLDDLTDKRLYPVSHVWIMKVKYTIVKFASKAMHQFMKGTEFSPKVMHQFMVKFQLYKQELKAFKGRLANV